MADTPQNGPYVLRVEPGNYAWCSCGRSEKEPYCDGSHKQCDPPQRPVIEEIKEEKNVAWCGCKKTQTPPYCDGTHSKL